MVTFFIPLTISKSLACPTFIVQNIVTEKIKIWRENCEGSESLDHGQCMQTNLLDACGGKYICMFLLFVFVYCNVYVYFISESK